MESKFNHQQRNPSQNPRNPNEKPGQGQQRPGQQNPGQGRDPNRGDERR